MTVSFNPAQPSQAYAKFGQTQQAKKTPQPQFGIIDGGICSIPLAVCGGCCAIPIIGGLLFGLKKLLNKVTGMFRRNND